MNIVPIVLVNHFIKPVLVHFSEALNVVASAVNPVPKQPFRHHYTLLP